jgi:hypothetical protein
MSTNNCKSEDRTYMPTAWYDGTVSPTEKAAKYCWAPEQDCNGPLPYTGRAFSKKKHGQGIERSIGKEGANMGSFIYASMDRGLNQLGFGKRGEN